MKITLYKMYVTILAALFCLNLQAQKPYGDNKANGSYIQLNGVKHYYEVYGQGSPLLLIHGNSSGIKSWAAQIEHFSKRYKVYAIDCRGRGKSELGKDTLSYIQQAKDMAAFIKQLNLDSVCVIGKSDGGIVGLLMGMYYPAHLKKIVAFSANLQPDTTAFYPYTLRKIHDERVEADHMLAKKDTTQNWYLIQQRNRMMEFQPHITAQDLHSIKIPVLVISGDRDLVKTNHTLFIYNNLPLASLCILNGETHYAPRVSPALFNSSVERFLTQPLKGDADRFKKP